MHDAETVFVTVDGGGHVVGYKIVVVSCLQAKRQCNTIQLVGTAVLETVVKIVIVGQEAQVGNAVVVVDCIVIEIVLSVDIGLGIADVKELFVEY